MTSSIERTGKGLGRGKTAYPFSRPNGVTCAELALHSGPGPKPATHQRAVRARRGAKATEFDCGASSCWIDRQRRSARKTGRQKPPTRLRRARCSSFSGSCVKCRVVLTKPFCVVASGRRPPPDRLAIGGGLPRWRFWPRLLLPTRRWETRGGGRRRPDVAVRGYASMMMVTLLDQAAVSAPPACGVR